MESAKSVTIDELRDLVEQQIFVRIGETGRGKLIMSWQIKTTAKRPKRLINDR